jgi:hypothetical protein
MPDGRGDLHRNKTENDITTEVLERFAATPNPRLRKIMLSLIGHLHAFVKDVQLAEAEWFKAIEVLTEAGKMRSDRRQEFILFSDTFGVSMVVDLIGHRKPEGATESTVFGPFHRLGTPEMPAGGNIAHRDTTGTPAIVTGRASTATASRSPAPCSTYGRPKPTGSTTRRTTSPTTCTCAASSAPTATGGMRYAR